jgi:hypothetical protein
MYAEELQPVALASIVCHIRWPFDKLTVPSEALHPLVVANVSQFTGDEAVSSVHADLGGLDHAPGAVVDEPLQNKLGIQRPAARQSRQKQYSS